VYHSVHPLLIDRSELTAFDTGRFAETGPTTRSRH
jgi:hypothetical protein